MNAYRKLLLTSLCGAVLCLACLVLPGCDNDEDGVPWGDSFQVRVQNCLGVPIMFDVYAHPDGDVVFSVVSDALAPAESREYTVYEGGTVRNVTTVNATVWGNVAFTRGQNLYIIGLADAPCDPPAPPPPPGGNYAPGPTYTELTAIAQGYLVTVYNLWSNGVPATIDVSSYVGTVTSFTINLGSGPETHTLQFTDLSWTNNTVYFTLAVDGPVTVSFP